MRSTPPRNNVYQFTPKNYNISLFCSSSNPKQKNNIVAKDVNFFLHQDHLKSARLTVWLAANGLSGEITRVNATQSWLKKRGTYRTQRHPNEWMQTKRKHSANRNKPIISDRFVPPMLRCCVEICSYVMSICCNNQNKTKRWNDLKVLT